MLNLISCELLKLKRSKMVLISVAGVLSTPLLMLIEALQTHFDKPEIIFTLSDIYSDSVLYIMLLVNIMIYVAIAAYLFSREYTESTLKTMILSILVDTFISKISLTMQPGPKIDSISGA